MNDTRTLSQVLLSPEVLVTFILCSALAVAAVWIALAWQRRRLSQSAARQRMNQEATIERLLDAVSQDKQRIVADYEARLREQEAQIAALQSESGRLRDRLASTGLLGIFSGRQRDVVSALLLENEQLHELLARKQEQLRDLVSDMTAKLVDRLDEQVQESAKAVRYKQALLSAFLEREETRRLLDQMLAEGKLGASPQRDALPEKRNNERVSRDA